MPYNIVFYFTDQQRWDTCGCFGQPLKSFADLLTALKLRK